MRATVMSNWELRVDDIDIPTPGPGQVLTKVLSCGICGSDLHLLRHGEESRRLSDELAEERAEARSPVGVPGMIEHMLRMAPKNSRILVVGACMQEDHFHPMHGTGKELSLQFVLGYSPEEFAASLDSIAQGRVDLLPLLTGTGGIDEIPRAFTDLANPEAHAKILVRP